MASENTVGANHGARHHPVQTGQVDLGKASSGQLQGHQQGQDHLQHLAQVVVPVVNHGQEGECLNENINNIKKYIYINNNNKQVKSLCQGPPCKI